MRLIRKISTETYNALLRKVGPPECDIQAERGDVCYVIAGLACMCQRRNDFNNIIAWACDGRQSFIHLRAMVAFLYILRASHGVEYVRIDGRKGRYRMMSRLFPTVRIDPEGCEGREVRYLHIDENTMGILRGLAGGIV